jgi:DNA-binding transcriptional LysR family regulator
VIHKVREVQTALGLVAAAAGACVVPVSVERLRRENIAFVPLPEQNAVSPIILSRRKGDRSSEIALIFRLIRDIYRKAKIDVAW